MFAPAEPLPFDVESFEQQLDVAWAAKEDAAKSDALTKAINLYQGDLFTGIYGDWCLIERERLAQKHLQALGELMHCHIRQNNFDMAVEVGQSILTDDPLREEVHRDLIFCYGRLGRRAEAAEQFQLCADYLMLELKVYPMPDTVSTYQQIVTGAMSQSLAGTNRDLLQRVNRANAEFQQAGNKLIKILNEIEYLNSRAIS
jgi:DNA-binding SARP family transcriptional activator